MHYHICFVRQSDGLLMRSLVAFDLTEANDNDAIAERFEGTRQQYSGTQVAQTVVVPCNERGCLR